MAHVPTLATEYGWPASAIYVRYSTSPIAAGQPVRQAPGVLEDGHAGRASFHHHTMGVTGSTPA